MRTALLYLLLVGGPALGVAWLLRTGEQLAPPAAVGGAWLVTASGAARPTCAPLGGRPGAVIPLTVEQSGTRLRVGVDGGLHRGTFDGGILRVRVPGLSCTAWQIEAVVGEREPARWSGQLVPEGCACTPVAFTAVRDTAGPSAQPAP